jgi:hypothetical protein
MTPMGDLELDKVNAYHATSRWAVAERLAFLYEAWGWRWGPIGKRVPLATDVKELLDRFIDSLGSDVEYPSTSIESGGLMVRPRRNEEDPSHIDEYEVYLRVGTL